VARKYKGAATSVNGREPDGRSLPGTRWHRICCLGDERDAVRIEIHQVPGIGEGVPLGAESRSGLFRERAAPSAPEDQRSSVSLLERPNTTSVPGFGAVMSPKSCPASVGEPGTRTSITDPLA
jgi:hypothetical protein